MHVELDQRLLADAAKAMDLTGLDDEDVTRAGLELFSVDNPESATLTYELYFIVGVAMRARATPGVSSEQEYRDVHVAMIGANELVRATLEREVLLPNSVHPSVSRTAAW